MSDTIFRVGFTGHQQLGDDATVTFVSQQLRELLITYQQQASERGQETLASSCLAPGSGRLFIKTALDLNIPVEAIIPCARYEEIFTSAEARAEYHHLLERCQHVHQLPLQECSDDAYLAAGQWIVDRSDVMILVWNGYPAAGRSGTGDIANYARLLKRPFVHVHTRLHTTKVYGSLLSPSKVSPHVTPRREFIVAKQTVYQGNVLAVNQYRLRMPNGEEIERDIVECPESVLVLPVGQQGTVLLIEKYDLGAGVWQLTLPGGKVLDSTPEGIRRQAEVELREEIGYRPGRLEKLLDFYSHPGYIAHKVHLLVAHDLEWDPLEMEDGEEIRVHTFTLDEALAATRVDYRCDPEAALALWLYADDRLQKTF